MNKKCVFLCLLLALLLSFAVCRAEEPYETLQKGDKSEAVLNLKIRMYYLGYFTSLNLSEDYNNVMVERVKQLQKANGLEETGIATPALQQLIYSDECVWKGPTPKPSPVPTPKPTPIAPVSEPELPQRDKEGFLTQAEPFVFADREDGHWIYLSDDVQIEIKRYEDTTIPLIWLEAYIKLSEDARLAPMLSAGKTPGRAFVLPTKLAEQNKAILAFNDDFYGYRWKYNIIQGVIIRDGVVYNENTRKAASKNWPPLDVIALFEDGSMKTFTSDEHTAEEYLAMGVTDTYAFGPIFVQDGQLHEDIANWSADDRDPRMAIGYIAPREYCVLNVLGRRSDSKGATIRQTAELIQKMGAVEALNLDGGNTTCMIFMNEIINRPLTVKTKDIRQITGMIGVTEPED